MKIGEHVKYLESKDGEPEDALITQTDGSETEPLVDLVVVRPQHDKVAGAVCRITSIQHFNKAGDPPFWGGPEDV